MMSEIITFVDGPVKSLKVPKIVENLAILVNSRIMPTSRSITRYRSFSRGFRRSIAPELALSEHCRMAHISASLVKYGTDIF